MRNFMPEFRAVVETHKEDNWYVATDLITNVSDYGSTKEEAIQRLKEGLQARYISIMERKNKSSKLVEVKVHA